MPPLSQVHCVSSIDCCTGDQGHAESSRPGPSAFCFAAFCLATETATRPVARRGGSSELEFR
eukprot:6011214-Pyramimonas_sp.AAC.1